MGVNTLSAPLRVLVVDDHPTIRIAVRALLNRLGHQVDVAENGRQALEVADRCAYDVVLLDIRMPGMDGLEVAHHLRERWPSSAETKIFVHTADVAPEDCASYFAAGVDDVLAKPVRMTELVAVFHRWFPLQDDILRPMARID